MEITSLENDLKAGKLQSIYLLYGEERYLLDNCLKKIKKLFGDMINGINYIQIDNNNIAEIISDIETPAFGYPKKLIIAKNTELFQKSSKKGKKSTDEDDKSKAKKDENKFENRLATYIDENMELIEDSAIIIFVENDVEKNNLYKAIEKNGCLCNFEKQKPVELAKRIKSICNAYKVNIDNSTLNYFIESCGTSLQDLINEIRKQIEYVGENGTITTQTIDLLAIKQFDSIIFDLTDNLGKKNISGALKVLRNLIDSKEPIQKIFITLYGHFKKLYITKIAINEKLNIAQSLNLKPNQTFLTTKYTMQSKYFKEEELRKILQEFIDLDYKVKNGMIDINVGLESVLCRYCS
ncbi:MAG: DNA polymerase III subunit delta [Clostridia bacterium]